MATRDDTGGEITPLSLYIDLVPGTRADIEVVSRAAIAWSEMIREAIFLIEPFAEVRVELVSGTEGSISLNSLINAVKGFAGDPKKLKAAALGLALFFSGQVTDWVIGKGLDAAWESASSEVADIWRSLTDEEKRETAETVSRIIGSKAAQERAKAVYTELSRDTRITAVGSTLRVGHRPSDLVPRSEFQERSAKPTLIEETIVRRTEANRVSLTLVSPNLSAADYKWKFDLGGKTLWARLEDEAFRTRIMPGSNSAPRMLTGIVMDVDLETVQEFRDGVWVIVDQHISTVHALREPPTQPSWFNLPVESDEP